MGMSLTSATNGLFDFQPLEMESALPCACGRREVPDNQGPSQSLMDRNPGSLPPVWNDSEVNMPPPHVPLGHIIFELKASEKQQKQEVFSDFLFLKIYYEEGALLYQEERTFLSLMMGS